MTAGRATRGGEHRLQHGPWRPAPRRVRARPAGPTPQPTSWVVGGPGVFSSRTQSLERPADLLPPDGCSIHLVRETGAPVGAIRGEGCASRLRGAAYAPSEVRVEPDR